MYSQAYISGGGAWLYVRGDIRESREIGLHNSNHIRSLNHVFCLPQQQCQFLLLSSGQYHFFLVVSFSLPNPHALPCTSGFIVPGCHHSGGGGGINQIIEVSKHVGHDFKQAKVLIGFKGQSKTHTHTPISSLDWQCFCEYSRPLQSRFQGGEGERERTA